MRVLWSTDRLGWFIRLEFVLQDFWIGAYWKNTPKQIDVWVCLIPCLPLHYRSPA